MSSSALFDEDSSDDNDDEEQSHRMATSDNDISEGIQSNKEHDKIDNKHHNDSTADNENNKDDNENDKDDESEEEDLFGGKSKKLAEKSKPQKQVVYSPDEEDNEFDDDQGIVGSDAPPKPQQPTDTHTAVQQPKKITVLQCNRPTAGTTLHITKLPNVVGIQPEPFDPQTFVAQDELKEYNGYVHNMIRWRYRKDQKGNFLRSPNGSLIRESNARIARWDDGSMTLHVGSEVFLCDVRPSDTAPGGYPGLNGYLYLSQKATFSNTNEKGSEHKDNNDDEEQPGGTVLECMGAIASKLSVRPSSLQSAAHKALTVAVRQKTTQRATIAQFVTNEDPEKLKEERIRQKTDLDKARARKHSSRSYYNSGGIGAGGSMGIGGSSRRAPGMNRRYMEEEEDHNYDSVNIRDLKRRNIAVDDMDYGDDDDSDDDEEEDIGWSKGKLAAMRNSTKRGRLAIEKANDNDEEEEEEFGVGGEDSDDEEQVALKKPKRTQTNLFDDDDDDDDDEDEEED